MFVIDLGARVGLNIPMGEEVFTASCFAVGSACALEDVCLQRREVRVDEPRSPAKDTVELLENRV